MEIAMQNSVAPHIPMPAVVASLFACAYSVSANATQDNRQYQAFGAEPITAREPQISTNSQWREKEISSVMRIRETWASFAADPLKLSTISQMRALLTSLQHRSDHVGHLIPGADGSLQAEWHRPDVSVGLLVESDGTFSAWARFEDDGAQVEEFGTDAIALFQSLAAAYRLNV